MEQEEDDTCTIPPFWAAEHHRDRRLLRRSYSLLLTSTSLLILLLVIALVFSLIIVPTLHSFTSNIFKPRTVKNSWDSLNLILVLFAIVCGFLSKNNNDALTPRSQYRNSRTFSDPSTPPPQWHRYNYSLNSQRSFHRLRSFNSYPDLRQQINADERFRFYDDTYILRNLRHDAEEEEKEVLIEHVDNAPPLSPPPPQGVRRNVERAFQVETIAKREIDDLDAKISQPPLSPPSPVVTRPRSVRRNVKRTYQAEGIENHETNGLDEKISPPSPPRVVATRPKSVRRNVKRTYQAEAIEEREKSVLDLHNSQPPPSPSPPREVATRPKSVRRNVKRTYQAEATEERETNDLDLQNSQPLPLSPPAAATRMKGVRRNAKPERNDSVVKSSPPPPPPPPPLPVEVKTVQGKKKRGIATKEFLTSLRGKKKQRQRSVENFDTILNSEPLVPEPPPPPPPPKVFQNLFSLKKGKHKKSHIVSVATATTSMSNKREHYSSYRVEDNVKMSGNESPLIPIPPPPPLPPFKLPVWKFRVQGDYVRVDSIGSSRSGSPDLDDVSVDTPKTSTHDDTSQCNSPFAKGFEDCESVSAPSLFCPSPDVDTKAHNFIESFRAGLRMAKMNSMKERQGIGRSNLGPSQNHEWN